MFLAVRDGYVMERSDTMEGLLGLDPRDYEVFEWNGPRPAWHPEDGDDRPLDPRTPAQRAQDAHERYRKRRLREYPPVVKQLDMMYWDAVNGTTTWVDEITRIKDKYPRPQQL
jgi:hypothetical protein